MQGLLKLHEMSRTRGSEAPAATPEAMLRKASLATTAGLRAKYALRGLGHPGTVDRTTRAMLLRQLYLSHMESRRFTEALAVAEQMVDLDVMPDVARQDAARAHLGLGDVDAATRQLRLASRSCPPSRRAFHLWTLGSVLCLNGHAREAVSVLSRAVRWGTTDRPLYRAQLALARIACEEDPGDLDELRERLAEAPCGQGYGKFVLGELAYHARADEAAIGYLSEFIARSTSGRIALAVALEAEVRRARTLLRRLRQRLRRRNAKKSEP